MPAKREMSMRQIRLMLRLAGEGVSAREIGRTVNVARSTIQDYLGRAKAAGLTWPLPDELTVSANFDAHSVCEGWFSDEIRWSFRLERCFCLGS